LEEKREEEEEAEENGRGTWTEGPRTATAIHSLDGRVGVHHHAEARQAHTGAQVVGTPVRSLEDSHGERHDNGYGGAIQQLDAGDCGILVPAGIACETWA